MKHFNMKINQIVSILPSQNIPRDLEWYEKKLGFKTLFSVDDMYAGLKCGDFTLHLQWHADTEDDPLLGGSMIRIFVDDIDSWFEECLKRGSVTKDKLRRNTPWRTHEFGLFDLNMNGITFVEDLL